ncbi:hypothetical protein QAD02_000701 [Eretmocerus hayati]|uniref:Uncharacterized protein n=1 Tax=Eretmocerus hayati TaxID=131215 RepID=A0ACC2NEB2_9HYME|nr:hypothetical protein QAD02_000701 [Eretmocerus hayati]
MAKYIRLKSRSGEKCWISEEPASPRYRRPLRLSFEKETKDNILNEYARIKAERDGLQTCSFTLSNGKNVKIKHKVEITMLDGKCVNACTDNAASNRCPMCHATQSEVAKGCDCPLIPENPQFGLGFLHALVRSMENLAQLAYKLCVQRWIIFKASKERKRKTPEKSGITRRMLPYLHESELENICVDDESSDDDHPLEEGMSEGSVREEESPSGADSESSEIYENDISR